MSEFRKILDQAFESIRDRNWGSEPGRFAVVVEVNGEKDWPAVFAWSPESGDTIETISVWRDAVIGQWMAVFEEAHGSIGFVTTQQGERPSLS